MFGKKQENQLPESEIVVSTIPEDFYGGKNPVVSFKNFTEIVDLKKNKEDVLTPSEKKKFQEATSAGAGKGRWHLVNLATNPKALILLAVMIFTLAILGVGGYYYIKNNFLTQKSEEVIPIVSLTPPITEQPTISSDDQEVVPTEPPVLMEPEIPKEIPLEFPSALLSESVDSDNDGLTDLAEEEFQTDPFDFDTDKDKYPDGVEIYNLYNPKGFEPQRLAESGLVKEYINQNFAYKLLIPINWATGSVDEEGRQILFSTLSGENIELRVFDLQENEDFNSWFLRIAQNQDITTLKDFETFIKYSGKMRDDGLVYYFIYNNRVYVLLYHTTDSSIVNYKVVISLVARSLDFGFINPVLPTQELLTTPPTSTEVLEEMPVSNEEDKDEILEINTEQESTENSEFIE